MEENTLIGFEHLTAVLEEYAQLVITHYKGELTENDINASGALTRSLSAQVRREGTAYEVQLSLASYWKYIEYGRKPGKFPPPAAILEWIKVKPVFPRPSRNGLTPSNKQLAYLIGRKIAREGIKAKPMIQDTLSEINEVYLPRIREALVQDVGGYLMRTLTLADGTTQVWSAR